MHQILRRDPLLSAATRQIKSHDPWYSPAQLYVSWRSHVMLTIVFGRNFDKFRQLFTIFGTNHPDDPCDWKIVKCPISTYTTLRNDDVIVTSLKNAVFARKETPEFTITSSFVQTDVVTNLQSQHNYKHD